MHVYLPSVMCTFFRRLYVVDWASRRNGSAVSFFPPCHPRGTVLGTLPLNIFGLRRQHRHSEPRPCNAIIPGLNSVVLGWARAYCFKGGNVGVVLDPRWRYTTGGLFVVTGFIPSIISFSSSVPNSRSSKGRLA